MQLQHIDTLDLPELEPYRTLRERTQHWKGDHVVAEGEKAVRALLQSELVPISLLMNQSWLHALEPLLQDQRYAATTVYLGDDALLDGIVGFSLHQRLLAAAPQPPNPTLEDLRGGAHGRKVHVALEGLADAENMGMILRNCAAFGVGSMVVGSDSCSPYLRRSVRVSLGNVFSLRIHRCEHLLETLQRCREELGWRIVGTTPRGGAHVLREQREMGGEICLLFGSEAEGLTPEALALCDEQFTIPMRGGVDSINVANAVAVSLYEATRHG
ncbi:RNA methyltransferase [bacterium]|nr:RNA methyltransferase [bacterium]